MTAVQLNLFVPRDVTMPAALAEHLHAVWPVIEPWGDLGGHRIRHVVEIDRDRFVLLLQSDSGHRWHLGWFDGRFYSSGAGWRDVDGRQLLSRRRAA